MNSRPGNHRPYESLLHSLTGRLGKVGTDGTDALFLPEVLGEAEALEERLTVEDCDLQAWRALGEFYWLRYEARRDHRDRIAARDVFEPSLLLGSVDTIPDPMRPEVARAATAVARQWLEEFDEDQTRDRLERAVRAWKPIADSLPRGDGLLPIALHNTASILRDRYDLLNTTADLYEAVEKAQKAAELACAENTYWSAVLFNLSDCLALRFVLTDELSDLGDAIDLCRQGLESPDEDEDEVHLHLSNLASWLHTRFLISLEQSDLDCAVTNFQEAIAIAPPVQHEMAVLASNLGAALLTAYEFSAPGDTLDTAVELARKAVDMTPVGHEDHPSFIDALGTALHTRFEHDGIDDDLEESIALHEDAVALGSGDKSRLHDFQANLGVALLTRAEHFGDGNDVDTAMRLLRQAAARRGIHEESRGMRLSHLGVALADRFERHRSDADLNASIKFGRKAVKAAPASPFRAGWLSNLGTALQLRFERLGRHRDINEAIDVGRKAVEAAMNETDRATFLGNLALALQDRFARYHSLDDINEAIETAHEAVQVSHLDDPYLATRLSNLGKAFSLRFEHSHDPADLDSAIDEHHRSIAKTSPGHVHYATRLFNLAKSFRAGFEHGGDPLMLGRAADAYREAAHNETTPPRERVRAAIQGGYWLADRVPEAGVDLLSTAAQLLPQAVSMRLPRAARQEMLGGHGDLAQDAAALLLRSQDPSAPGTALQVLESGRTVLLGQLLDIRTDAGDLRAYDSDLADRYEQLCHRLNRDIDDQRPIRKGRHITDDERHRLAQAFRDIVDEIRVIPQFSDFLRPPDVKWLREQATDGPIVVLNASRYGCHAVIVRRDGLDRIQLDTDLRSATSQVAKFHHAMFQIFDSGTDEADITPDVAAALEVLTWLWHTVAKPVLESLRESMPDDCGQTSHVWWVPGGLFGAMPLHAAGDYGNNPRTGVHPESTIDHAVSSYTPTIRQLHVARQKSRNHAAGADAVRIAAVAMEHTPHHEDLPKATEEVVAVRRHFPRQCAPEDELVDDRATYSSVSSALQRCHVAHLVAHAFSDMGDPSMSLIKLHDYEHHPLTVVSLLAMDLGEVRLAYLSGCRTAQSLSTDLLNESLHLTSACQVAGYPHVVGTLWKIGDDLAAAVAERFYAGLRGRDGHIDTNRSAVALHRAILAIRDEIGPHQVPYLWGAWLHSGA